MKEPIIFYNDFSFKYHLRNDWVLKNINLHIEESEFVIITGSSGSGKSTLCYAILGLIPHFYAGNHTGDVLIDNKIIADSSISTVLENVGYIPQRVENSLITPYVFTEIAFPLEYRDYKREVIKNRIIEISESLEINELLFRNPQKLSEGEKQKVAVSCALATTPKIIVADEPLANLDKKNQKRIISFFQKMKREKKTIVISTHDYKKYLDLKPRIIRIENGSIREDNQRIKETQGESLKLSKKVKQKTIQKRNEEEIPLVELENVFFDFPGIFKLTNISLRIFGGEIIGITGDNGSGKTTLLKLMCGLLKPKEGKIRVKGNNINSLNWKEIATNFGVIFQNPELQFFEETIDKELLLISKNLNENVSFQDIERLLSGSGLRQYKEHNPHSLSHGEKRRLAFLSSIIHNPDIVILDEITNGLDKNNKAWIVNQLLELKKKNKAIVVISHEWDWIKENVDKTVLLDKGKILFQDNSIDFQKPSPKQALGGVVQS